MAIIYHNGKFKEDSAAVLRLDDRALRGHGAFDTMLVLDGQLMHAEMHFKRLLNDAGVFGIPVRIDVEFLTQAAQDLIAQNDAQTGRFALNTCITMGPGERGLKSPQNPDSQVTMRLSPTPDSFPDLKVIIAQRARRNEHSPLSLIKSFNYGENILAMQEAEKEGANEAIMLNTAGHVACATSGNIFIAKGEQLFTPALSDGVLNGVTRQLLIDRYDVVEKSLSMDDLNEADSIYLTNSLRGCVPVVELDGRALSAPSLHIPQFFHLD